VGKLGNGQEGTAERPKLDASLPTEKKGGAQGVSPKGNETTRGEEGKTTGKKANKKTGK